MSHAASVAAPVNASSESGKVRAKPTPTAFLADLETSLQPAYDILYRKMQEIPATCNDPALRSARDQYNEAIALISRALHTAKDANHRATNTELGSVVYEGDSRSANDNRVLPAGTYMGSLLENPWQLVLVRTSALGAGETLEVRTINNKKRLMVRSYGEQWRNPPYTELA